MEKIVSKIAALGVPGLILFIAISTSGFAGGAAIAAALSALGPGGIVGGILTLGIIGLIVESISKYGTEAIFCEVVKKLYENGETKESIITKFQSYPISKGLKSKIAETLNKMP